MIYVTKGKSKVGRKPGSATGLKWKSNNSSSDSVHPSPWLFRPEKETQIEAVWCSLLLQIGRSEEPLARATWFEGLAIESTLEINLSLDA